MITIAVDPGKVTGIAIWFHEHDPHVKPYLEEIEGRIKALDWLSLALITYTNDEVEVVCEYFRITQTTGRLSQQYDALYIIGALEFLCHVHKVPFHTQETNVKVFASDRKLKELEWYKASKGGHQNDAARHLLWRLIVVHKDTGLTERLAAIL